ncbi:alpha/beta fold hydrolase [Psychroflexus tropicus]|uniref:alpha/beta fold hydrolase n=1 Tax=Psychroflexus tropicus TaxID=197345 RepID=UPI000369813D|nr:alpha/beta hydrolase [Psychroflexus tropicus]
MTFTYKQTKVHFTSSGEGEPIILLHGFLENSSMWKDLQQQLSETHSVFALDLPGHGNTEAIGYIHTMEEYAALVLAFADHQKMDNFSVIGHSMGGYVALALAEPNPHACLGGSGSERIKKLILLNSSPLADSESKKKERNRAITMIQKHPEAFVRMAVKHLFLPEDQKRLSAEINLAISEAEQCSQQGIINTLKGMRDRKDRTEVLRQMLERSLIVLGEEDKVVNFEKTKAIAEKEGVPLKILPGGHMSHMEFPDMLLKTVQEFLSR